MLSRPGLPCYGRTLPNSSALPPLPVQAGGIATRLGSPGPLLLSQFMHAGLPGASLAIKLPCWTQYFRFPQQAKQPGEAIYWDRNDLCLGLKRLESERFKTPLCGLALPDMTRYPMLPNPPSSRALIVPHRSIAVRILSGATVPAYGSAVRLDRRSGYRS
jgi:hypothetical protein